MGFTSSLYSLSSSHSTHPSSTVLFPSTLSLVSSLVSSSVIFYAGCRALLDEYRSSRDGHGCKTLPAVHCDKPYYVSHLLVRCIVARVKTFHAPRLQSPAICRLSIDAPCRSYLTTDRSLRPSFYMSRRARALHSPIIASYASPIELDTSLNCIYSRVCDHRSRLPAGHCSRLWTLVLRHYSLLGPTIVRCRYARWFASDLLSRHEILIYVFYSVDASAARVISDECRHWEVASLITPFSR